MLVLKTNMLELRGIVSKVSQKTQKPYYVIYCEDPENITPVQFVCKDFNALPEGMKKGELIVLTLEYNRFKELDVLRIERA